MRSSLFRLLKEAPFPFLKINRLKCDLFAAIAFQHFPLKVKADQRTAFVMQLQRRIKSFDAGQVAEEGKQHGIAVSVNSVAFKISGFAFIQAVIQNVL